ncbi:MAG: hypothetical protein R3B68_16675 [Phycisphaerales bacterium]
MILQKHKSSAPSAGDAGKEQIMATTTRKKSGSRSSNGSIRTRRSPETTEAKAAMAEVRSDVAALRDDTSRLLHGIEAAAAEKLGQIAGRSKAEITHAHDEVRDFVSARPITSLAVAVGVGAILARIIR